MVPTYVDCSGTWLTLCSGLGFSICCRLIDDFVRTHPAPQVLTVVVTTRSTKKGNDTVRRLHEYLSVAASSSSPATIAATAATAASRVKFISENVDLSSLVSVRALSRRLVRRIPKLDAIVLNAGLGGWTGIDWLRATWEVCTDLVHAVSWPSYKLGPVGVVTESQIPAETVSAEFLSTIDEPRLGAIFCANVFGHYMLAHNLVPLLNRSGSPNGPGRIIWISSLEATLKLFDVDDIQGLRSESPYESSKALTDILALTSNQPCAAPWVRQFYSTADVARLESADGCSLSPSPSSPPPSPPSPPSPPNMYLTHPGICGTGILPLPLPLFYAMLAVFWIARLLGSPWHTLSTYIGASAPVWAALAAQRDLDAAERPYRQHGGGRVKWGSSCNRAGRDQPACTEIDGWGFGGVVGSAVVDGDRWRRRKRGATDLTAQQREDFEHLARQCWKQMEELRVLWDGILDAVEREQDARKA